MGKKDSPAAGTSGGQGAGNPAADVLAQENIGESAPGLAATSNPNQDTGATFDSTSAGAMSAADAGTDATQPGADLAVFVVSHMNALVPGMRVTAHRDGYRRAGRAWSKQATLAKVAEFSKEQLHQLRLDPNLTVYPTYIDDAEPEGGQQ